jgi:hypothetical protein
MRKTNLLKALVLAAWVVLPGQAYASCYYSGDDEPYYLNIEVTPEGKVKVTRGPTFDAVIKRFGGINKLHESLESDRRKLLDDNTIREKAPILNALDRNIRIAGCLRALTPYNKR